jgi:hypothetical protein
MALMRRQFLALVLIVPLGLSSVAFGDSVSKSNTRLTGYTVVDDPDVAHHLNSFAMIFGHCVWIPPSPKAALAGFGLFFGIDTTTEPDIAAAEATIVSQYIAAGKSQSDADKEVVWLNACFGTYEVPPENRNHPTEPGLKGQLQQARKPFGEGPR